LAALRIVRLGLTFALVLVGILSTTSPAQDLIPEEVADKAARRGMVRVIVTLATGFVPEPDLPTPAHVGRQRQAFAGARAVLSAALAGTRFRIVRAPAGLPVLALEVDTHALAVLRGLRGVVADVVEDHFIRRSLAQSVPLVGAPGAWALGFDGTGTIIAIVDDGVESTHPFLAGKVVREACFSTNLPQFSVSSVCPGGVEFSDAPGSGAPCDVDCSHGTHVAGIAAGGDGLPGSGVAKGAALWAIQVFSRADDPDVCFPEPSPCTGVLVGDLIEALNYLYAHRTSVPGMVLAAANMSLGGSPTGTTTCNGNPVKPAIDQLRAAKIASVIAAGNDGLTNALSQPACISTAVSVGSTGDTAANADSVSFFSNMASFLSLLAPGENIVSSVPPNGFASFNGTSMATPHVAGAFAILRQFAPQATVTDILNALRASGEPVTDTRPPFCFNTVSCPAVTVPRIQILEALKLLRPDLVVSAVTAPTPVGAGQKVAVVNSVRNQSTVSAAGAFDVGIYLSTNNVIDPSTDQLLTTRSVAGLAPSATSSATTSVTIPNNLTPGTYFIGVVADSSHVVTEANETNNTRASSAIMVVAPDVATIAATAPATAAPGAVVSVTNTVKNNASAPVSTFTVGFYLSTDDVLDGGDVPLGTRTIASLAANAVSTAATPLTIPVGTAPGVYRIIVRADDGQAFTETDETNNVRATGPIVIGPDLVVTAVTAPLKAQPGQTIALSGTVQNVGSAMLPGQTSTLAYYLSSDTVLGGGDVLLGTRTVPGLGVGATSPGTTMVTVPAVPVGSYFVIARADDGHATSEARENNNTRATATPIVVGPDVTVTVATGPAGAAPGLPVTISNTVVNKGPVAVGFTVGFYLSTDDVFDGGDVPLGTRTVTVLGAGAGSAAATMLTIPANTAPGVYRVLVRADSGGALGEADETNNVKATGLITVALPDLQVTAVTAPPRAAPGATVNVSHTVRNAAGAPGAAPASVSRFRLSSDDAFDAGDTDLGTANVPALGPGLSATVAKLVTIPPGTPPGAYFIVVRADDADAIAEVAAGNNTRAAATPIIVGPDLVVTAVTAPLKAQAGQTIALSGTVQNVGSALLPAQTSTLAYYLSSDTVLGGGDVLLGTRTVPGLGAGAASAGTTMVTVPAVPVGSYFVIARADDGNTISEARENNNTRATAAPIVVGPDVAVTVATGPAAAVTGRAVTISNTVVNKGPVAVSFTVGFYLSSDEVFDGGDVPLGTRTVTSLAAGAASAAATVLTIPVNTAPGVYRVLVRADSGGALGEVDEANNVKATGPLSVASP
jgi:subtilisin family serine protease